ncbi:hypothetical protein GCM10008024_39160 [Allgaiera indica]|uniref:Uncharacterized protein n=1 Tax=Allgaiera indica TaxID=765699 RepID=A0AAN4UUX3_9RHOB|nr:hypothetical protein GCM10008024_39160 [Allgaiera indica]
MAAETPAMRRMFAMFEPTMFPKAMPGDPVSPACTDVTNSGIEVPKPTRVRPITSGEMPIRSAV